MNSFVMYENQLIIYIDYIYISIDYIYIVKGTNSFKNFFSNQKSI